MMDSTAGLTMKLASVHVIRAVSWSPVPWLSCSCTASGSRVALNWVSVWFLLALVLWSMIGVLCGWLRPVGLSVRAPGPGSGVGPFFQRASSPAVACAWLPSLKNFLRAPPGLCLSGVLAASSPLLGTSLAELRGAGNRFRRGPLFRLAELSRCGLPVAAPQEGPC